MGYYNTFVVKIWCHASGEMTRGHIQHVSSQELIHFLNLETMTDFIKDHLAPEGAPSGVGVVYEERGETSQDE